MGVKKTEQGGIPPFFFLAFVKKKKNSGCNRLGHGKPEMIRV